jgi:hypothetical protein
MTATGRLPFVRASGSPFAVGVAHGEIRGAALRAFLGDSLSRLNRVMATPVSMDDLAPMIMAYGDAIAAATPELAEEIRGLAHGARITWQEALLLQLRREVMGYRKIPALGGCTTFARDAVAAAGRQVLAQTIDINGDLDDQICVLDVRYTDSPRRALVLSFGGLLGYVGLNSAGLAVGINLVLGGDWHAGVPPYLAVRHLLNSADDVDSAVSILMELPLASSRSLMLCDAEKAAYVELVGTSVRVVSAPEAVHTNHFLHQDLVPCDEVNVFSRNSSLRRLETCRNRLADTPPSAGPEDYFSLLASPPILVPDVGDIRRDRTVAAVVMAPATGELHIRPGDPSRAATQTFSLCAAGSEDLR